jgi:hypothetical protein
MMSPQRFDTLKQITDPREFYNALLCDIPSIVKKHRDTFEAKMQDFDKKCREYKAACDKAIDWKAVKKAVKDREDGRVRCITSLNPPKDGWKRIETQCEGTAPKGGRCSFPWHFWAPPDFPDNPADWFDIYIPFHYNPGNLFASKATCAPEDELLRDYVAVACLFNKGAEKRGEMPVSPEILLGIEISVECETLSEKQTWPKVKGSLIGALEAVDRDLASTKPSETKQNALLAKNEEQEGVIVPKPPEFLQTLLWLWRHGKKHWKLILLAAIIMLLGFILQLVL